MQVSELELWFLSGKPVVRLQWRDFGDTINEYTQQMHQLAQSLRLGVAVLSLSKAPGVLVQTFLGELVPQLEEPRLIVTPKTMPWLFCTAKGCKTRVSFPGENCTDHNVIGGMES